MLTLLDESPGGKRGNRRCGRERTSSTGKTLVSAKMGRLMQRRGDDDLYAEMLPEQHSGRRRPHLDNFLSSSNPDDYSEKWHEDFSHRPSWCDAGMCLQQIRRGKAIGNKPALYSRGLMQKMLFFIGTFVQAHALQVFMVLLVAFGVCCVGLQSAHIETDIIKLWVSRTPSIDATLAWRRRPGRQMKRFVLTASAGTKFVGALARDANRRRFRPSKRTLRVNLHCCSAETR
uniref:Uncharacterized protein n=1 Tax=Plectus sambesii TaxID=2011161 RepID=A0A914W8P8_9BILA